MKTRSAVRFAVAVAALGLAGGARAQSAVSDVMTQALSQRAGLPAAAGSMWRFEGPRSLSQAGGYPYGRAPYSGRINALAIDPSGSSILYATGATGGLWKSNDGGAHWAARSGRVLAPVAAPTWPLQSATAVAVDPNLPNRVYVGTGDYRRIDHVLPFSAGILRSLDGGLTWVQLGADVFRPFTVSRIVVDPLDSRSLVATAGRGGRLPGGGIFRSTTTGGTWTAAAVPDANWDDLALCDQHVFWAAATRAQGAAGARGALLLQSTDGGTTWKSTGLSSYLAGVTPVPEVLHLACGQTVSGTPFVLVAVFRGSGVEVFATVNQGATFTQLSQGQLPSDSNGNPWGGPWAHSAFGVTANRIYLGGTTLFKAGLSGLFTGTSPHEQPIAGSLTLTPAGDAHGDFQCVVPDPDEADAVFLCNDAGVYHYSEPLNRMASLSATLGVTQIFRMDVHRANANLIAFGAQDLGSSVSFFQRGRDAAAIQAPLWSVVAGSDGRDAVFQDDASSTVYLAQSAGGVARYDGVSALGNLLVDQCEHGGCESGLAYRAEDDALDFAKSARELFELIHPGQAGAAATWAQSSLPTLIPGTSVRAPFNAQTLATCPSDGEVLLAGSTEARLQFTLDGTASWTFVTAPGLPSLPMWALSPLPSQCGSVLAALGAEAVETGANAFFSGARLFRSSIRPQTDGSWTLDDWTAVAGTAQPLPGGPIYAIARHPSAPERSWFVAGDAGVFRTDDAGASWTNAGDALGLPNAPVRDLRLSGDGATLFAGTFGRGVWSMDVGVAPGFYGVRGVVTQASAPIAGATVSATGAGRITRWLRNTLTNGVSVTTGPVEVTASATISSAAATLTARNALSAQLVSPGNASFAMAPVASAGGVTQFALTPASAAALSGVSTLGAWRFAVTGTILISPGGIVAQFPPVIATGNVDFRFADGVRTVTGSDGEYTLEALAAGVHAVAPGLAGATQQTVQLASHQAGVDFAIAPVGTFDLRPRRASVEVGRPAAWTLGYTITDGRGWRELRSVDLLFREGERVLLRVRFDPALDAFRLVDPETGAAGPALPAGSPRPLQDRTAKVLLDRSSVQVGAPDHSSVTLKLEIAFKERAAGRTLDVAIEAADLAGVAQGPSLGGRVTVAERDRDPER